MSGTFIIRPTFLVSGGSPLISVTEAFPGTSAWTLTNFPPDTILQAMRDELATEELQALVFSDTTGLTFNDILRFIFDGASIYLDGSPTPIAFGSLPSGFTPASASVNINIEANVQPNLGGSCHYHLQQEAGNNGPEDTLQYIYDFSIPPSMLDIVSNGCGFKVNIIVDNGADIAAVAIVYNLRIEGTYNIQAFTWVLEPVQEPILPGARVTVRSVGSANGGLGFTQLINVNPAAPTLSETYIQYLDGDGNTIQVFIPVANFLFITLFLYVFLLPSFPVAPVGDIELFVTGDGTQFSGSVSLGILQVMNADGSGIYRITKNKRSDSRYDRDQPGEITEVAIPNPIAKTGYIGG